MTNQTGHTEQTEQLVRRAIGDALLAMQRLTAWLESGDPAAPACAEALSLNETDDPITIANWTDGIAFGLEHAINNH
ncbi:MAG: hypothetical protein QM695_16350 [Micropruina sp.]